MKRRSNRDFAALEAKIAGKRLEAPKLRNPSPWYWLPCLAAFLVYIPSLSFDFVHDDWPQIVGNVQIHSWSFLPRLLSTPLWSHLGQGSNGSYYRPLFSLWMLLVYTIAGLSPGLWHLSNVLLHVVVTFLVFRVSSAVLNGRVAAASAALLFAIHPVHIEDVCWVSASNEMLYVGLLLLSLLFLFRSQSDGVVWLRLSIAAWGAALLTKETAIALLPIFVILAFWGCSKSKLKERAKTALAYTAVAATYFAVRSIVLANMLGKPSGEASWRQVLITSPIVAKFYLWKLVCPINLGPFHTLRLETEVTPAVLLTGATITAMLFAIALVVIYSRKRQVWAVGAALVFLPLLPAIAGIHFFQSVTFEAVHERYLYLPSVGLVMLFGMFFEYARHRWRSFSAALAVVLVGTLACLNLSQQAPYRDEEANSGKMLRAYCSSTNDADPNCEFMKTADWRPRVVYPLLEQAIGTCHEGRRNDAQEILDSVKLSPSLSSVVFFQQDGYLNVVGGQFWSWPLKALYAADSACMEQIGEAMPAPR